MERGWIKEGKTLQGELIPGREGPPNYFRTDTSFGFESRPKARRIGRSADQSRWPFLDTSEGRGEERGG